MSIEYRVTFKGFSDPDHFVPEHDHSAPFEGSFEEALALLKGGRRLAVRCGLPADHARLEARTVSPWRSERIMRLVNQVRQT